MEHTNTLMSNEIKIYNSSIVEDTNQAWVDAVTLVTPLEIDVQKTDLRVDQERMLRLNEFVVTCNWWTKWHRLNHIDFNWTVCGRKIYHSNPFITERYKVSDNEVCKICVRQQNGTTKV